MKITKHHLQNAVGYMCPSNNDHEAAESAKGIFKGTDDVSMDGRGYLGGTIG